ncbi:hypothetical protein FRC08_016680 [Ceratobasidium sp. 394]|nr:hypothetical protein FRC08_016680 [Ceratobasidium sp. 394]
MRLLRESSCCPSFILVVAGPWMCVLGAIYLEQPVVEPLTDFIWIGPWDCLSDGVESVARVFHALTTSLISLRFFYDNLDRQVGPGRFYPWITYFLNDDGHKSEFQYIDTLGGEYHQRKAVFKAQTMEPNPRTIVVKFTRRHNGQAHRLLAEHGYAPKLLFDRSEHPDFPRPADLLMIVMVYIAEAPQGPSYDAYPTLRAALGLLHDRGLVFGDLRSLNVLVPECPTGRGAKAMLIDFDWCGRDGVDRYPLDINTEVAWADGVGPGTLMYKHHDDFMLESVNW